ncbi:hypothetical protein AY600_07880 [Phormidium willei BDU 130791]|nr:hypothetical protein AY600_07880 [Phormidium willei BDU 130791]
MEANQAWNLIEEAFEIVNIQSVFQDATDPVLTYKSADDPNHPGDNEIPAQLWPDYEISLPYIKNTTRNLQFNESQFLASPGEPLGSTAYITTSDGYSWAFMSEAINTMWPYNQADYEGIAAQSSFHAGSFVPTPLPGVVTVTANFKGQNLKFWANEDGVPPGRPDAVSLDRYFVTDVWGNEYIMHASGQSEPSAVAQAFNAAILPEGWTKDVRQLSEDLILTPAEGADGTFHYVVIRDSADNSYHQIKWSDTGSLTAQTENMPIWGGQDNNVLAGDTGGIWNDTIHGAGGDDLLVPGLGNDILWGDAGLDTIVLPGRSTDYIWIESSEDSTYLAMAGLGYVKQIHHAELLQFEDTTIAIADFIENSRRSTEDVFLGEGKLPVAFRLFDRTTGSHVFTASFPEVKQFLDQGWTLESTPFAVNPNDPSAQNVYRLDHPTETDFLLTMSEQERHQAIRLGYIDQGVVFTAHAEPSPLASEPVYRFFSLSATNHMYTTSEVEQQHLLALGYQFEEIAFYVSSP